MAEVDDRRLARRLADLLESADDERGDERRGPRRAGNREREEREEREGRGNERARSDDDGESRGGEVEDERDSLLQRIQQTECGQRHTTDLGHVQNNE